MSRRNVDNLEQASPAGAAKEPRAAPATAAAAPMLPTPAASAVPLVTVSYPEPTPLAIVVRDVAKWSGLCFVMEASCNVRVQIFAEGAQPLHHAYELFLAALAVAGLRAVQVGNVVKIVPPALPLAI